MNDDEFKQFVVDKLLSLEHRVTRIEASAKLLSVLISFFLMLIAGGVVFGR